MPALALEWIMTTNCRCSIAALLAALSIASPSALADDMSDGVERRQAVDGVTVYTVHEEPIAETKPLPPTINVNTTVKLVIVRRHPRWEQYRRALGQRYTGFIRMYAGPQYPF